MPELPEVETVCQGLEPLVKNRVLEEPLLYYRDVVKHPGPDEFACSIKGEKILEVARKGKYLLFFLSGGGRLVVHLGMTGALVWGEPGEAGNEHLRAVFPLHGGGGMLFFDSRKFGKIRLEKPGESLSCLENLGPDWWKEVSLEVFLIKLERRPGSRIKPLLMDQCFLCGLGNIYVDEALFRAGIMPERRVVDLSEKEKENLFKAVKETLRSGIKAGGTSTRNYRNARGEKGHYQEKLLVYGRKGDTCFRCGTCIERIVVGGRGTHFCASCQA